MCHGDLAAEGSAHCDDSGNLVFDGDDAVTLECGGAILDAIGRIGERPGPAWGQGDTSTRDRTLRRRCGIEEGDTNAADAFDPTDEWEGLPEDTVEGLGEHTVACPG